MAHPAGLQIPIHGASPVGKLRAVTDAPVKTLAGAKRIMISHV